MRLAVPIVAAPMLAASLGGCDLAAGPTCVTASAPSIRLPAVAGRPGAGYFEIEARSGRGNLLSVSSPRIGRIEMHQTTNANGVSSMHRMERMTANSCNRFATTDGRHLMLFALDPSLRPGDQISLTFHFERGEPVNFAATVVAAGDEYPH